MQVDASLTASEARLVLNSLRNGTVPLEYAHVYNVNRDVQLEELRSEICAPANNGYRLKFVNGEYGQGKTQMLGVVRWWAIQEGYAASHVVLHSRGTSLGDLRSVYAAILRNLWRPGRKHSEIQAVLEVIFGRYVEWKSHADPRTLRCSLHHNLPMLYCEHCYEQGAVEEQYLPGFEELAPIFRRAVSRYRRAASGLTPDRETKENVVRFLEDDLGYRHHLNFIGIWSPMSGAEILLGLNQISRIFRLAGLKGMVIALDEAEAIPSIGGSSVARAYSNLADLIQAAQQSESIYFIYATTPTFFDDVKTHAPTIAAKVSPTTRMNLVPLLEADLVTLGEKICELRRIAGDVSVNEAKIPEIVRAVAAREAKAGLVSVRHFVTDLFAGLPPAI